MIKEITQIVDGFCNNSYMNDVLCAMGIINETEREVRESENRLFIEKMSYQIAKYAKAEVVRELTDIIKYPFTRTNTNSELCIDIKRVLNRIKALEEQEGI